MQQEKAATPLMQQYYAIKKEYADQLVFFQVGDFYELFFEDACIAAQFLGITLTKRGKVAGKDIPLCGVPVHTVDHYIKRVVKGGYTVALCQQLEEARPGTVVKRGVTRVFTPGTLVETQLLDEKTPSYLCTFFPATEGFGLLSGELLTGQLFATYLSINDERLLENELARFFPDEIVVPYDIDKQFFGLFKKFGYTLSPIQVNDTLMQEPFDAWVKNQFFKAVNEQIRDIVAFQKALYYFYAYLNKTNRQALGLFKTIHVYRPEDFLQLDYMTQKNLELVVNTYDGSRNHTLLQTIDKSVTAMGSRMIKKWILRPLLTYEAIAQRHEVVEWFITHPSLHLQIQTELRACADVERAVGRILIQRGQLSDLLLLRSALSAIKNIKEILLQSGNTTYISQLFTFQLENLDNLKKILQEALVDDPLQDAIIKKGFNQELDNLQDLYVNGAHKLLALEKEEQEKTGITTLKIRFNTLYGYYIEMTKMGAARVPSYYKSVQSLVGKERYTIEALELLAHRIEQAKSEYEIKQQQLFDEVKKEVVMHGAALRKISYALAYLDGLAAFATVAMCYGYSKPSFNNDKTCSIEAGRHPVVEQHMSCAFIANDIHLTKEVPVWIITGPNMGGKSTYLRQTALICILAHIGSYVPAKQANIPLLDCINTRIGSGDFIAGGESTFLVEMKETAQICQYATKKSLVILDEVGRGTSTIDGRSIAQAVIEHLAQENGPLCLFATHYHELTLLQDTHSFIEAHFMASKKTENGILFLYQLIKGVADGSFGIEIAKLAKLPESIIKRSRELCEQALQEEYKIMVPAVHIKQEKKSNKLKQEMHTQLVEKLLAIDINKMTPLQAFDLLVQLKNGMSSE
ncbi:MAG TPA: DNA mismatch repair protein MutS [Patescibacteria group bacterium]|jgi:DNA mismatch repair protein MutS|nr:DNA mismatch repair protein MutS [Patescibacteria group bacterium]